MQSSLELVNSEAGSARFRLSGVLDFASVVALNRQAGALFGEYRTITVDMSGITYVNSAGLALLLEWQRQSINSGRTIRIEKMPPKLLEIARISELESILQ